MNAAPPKLKPTPKQSLTAAEAPANDWERKRQLGQFFTPPDVAGFLWDLLEVIHGKRFNANARFIDPACGEGVFLRMAHERARLSAKSLFGADIDEALARGWNAHAVEHLSALWKSLRSAGLSPEAARFAVTDTIEKIGGARPKTFEAFVREQQQDLATQPLAASA